jgi:hypothetical protein
VHIIGARAQQRSHENNRQEQCAPHSLPEAFHSNNKAPARNPAAA